jgi:putative oxidoreductase
MNGAEHFENEIGFFKNVSIAAGFLELYVMGPGKWSFDEWFRVGASWKPVV